VSNSELEFTGGEPRVPCYNVALAVEFTSEGGRVIQLRHKQRSIWEGLFAEEVAELWEPWMRVVDELLEDEELVDAVTTHRESGIRKAAFAGGSRRRPKSPCAC
jgi:hypothetical protein